MKTRFICAILDSEGNIPTVGTNDRIPITGIKTLSGACRRISKYNINKNKPFVIIDLKDGTIYPSEYVDFAGGEWG